MLITSTEIIEKEHLTPSFSQNLRLLYFLLGMKLYGTSIPCPVGQDIISFCFLMISSLLSPSYGRNAHDIYELVGAPVTAIETRETRGCVDTRFRS